MTVPDRPRAEGPSGYRLVLPEGWVRLNVRDDIQTTVTDALTMVSFDSLPRDERPRRRAAIEGRLRLAVANAQKIDAYAMYLPLGGMHGLAIPASFVVAEATDFSGSGPQTEVLTQLLSEPGSQAVVLDGSDGVRTESQTSSLDQASGAIVPARQIVYVVPVPETMEWLIVVFDVIAGEEMDDDRAQFVDALVALFDGIMTTFRWTFSETE